MKSATKRGRRAFLGHLLLAAVAAPGLIAWAARRGKTAPAPLPEGSRAVSESHPLAKSIGYVHDARKVDGSRYPQRKKPENARQFCDGCSLYTKVNGGWGRCLLFQDGLVAAKGWCASYNRRS